MFLVDKDGYVLPSDEQPVVIGGKDWRELQAERDRYKKALEELLYLPVGFENPTSGCVSCRRRQEIAQAALEGKDG